MTSTKITSENVAKIQGKLIDGKAYHLKPHTTEWGIAKWMSNNDAFKAFNGNIYHLREFSEIDLSPVERESEETITRNGKTYNVNAMVELVEYLNSPQVWKNYKNYVGLNKQSISKLLDKIK